MGPTQGDVVKCPACGWQNRPGSKFCAQCRAPLTGEATQHGFLEDMSSAISGIFHQVRSAISGQPEDEEITQASGRPATNAQPPQPVDRSYSAPTRILSGTKPVVPLNRGDKLGYFYLTEVIAVPETPHLAYYYARWINCPGCGAPLANIYASHCSACGRELADLLIRQSSASISPEDKNAIQQLTELSQQEPFPGILPHLKWFIHEDRLYTVLSRPRGSWQPLPALPTRQPLEMVVNWFREVAGSIDLLHQRGYIVFDERRKDLRDPFIITGEQVALLADLTGCRPAAAFAEPVMEMKRDIRQFGRLAYWLLTGNAMGGNLQSVPPALRAVLEKARGLQYTSAVEFLSDLEKIPQPPLLARGLRQSVGYATDIGVARDKNEDYVSQYSFALEQTPGAPQVGLYIVADGMGGHDAGERASQDVVRVIVEKIHEKKAAPDLRRSTRLLDQEVNNEGILAQAIARANQVLFEARRTGGSDRGTTLTAAFIVGSTATIANIGDSRTYLFRGSQLEQITRDHSLVASLVAAGQISKDEARQHPARNQVYRTLGEKQKVEPDFFPVTIEPDDLLLLCSDGLWEMVTDRAIEGVLRQPLTPQKMCDELIRLANAAGGEDNISVIIIKIE